MIPVPDATLSIRRSVHRVLTTPMAVQAKNSYAVTSVSYGT
jgi:hypothetical protein